MRSHIYHNSIVLVGPAGAGKSLISRELATRTGLPLIITDLMRHCPKDVAELEERLNELPKELEQLINKPEKTEEERKKIKHLKNDLWRYSEQLRMRKMLPNVSNYCDMGWNGEVSSFLDKNFGKVAWHYYEKQFENQLLTEIIDQLTQPVILDTGAGMTISLEREYLDLTYQFLKLDAKKFRENFDELKVGYGFIRRAILPFRHIIELKLPENYKQSMHGLRASQDELNEKFIASGQYSKYAEKSISVEGLIESKEVNKQKLDEICDAILYRKKLIKK